MSKKIFCLFVSVSTILFFIASSCNRMDKQDFEAIEQQNIDNYISSNPNLNFTVKESGLYYLSLTPGTGDPLAAKDTAYVVYTGKFLSGYVFDTNVGADTFKVPIGGNLVIPGFEEAISYMKSGGKSICLIPSKLAYGVEGNYPYIPSYSPLLFEITLGRIVRGPHK